MAEIRQDIGALASERPRSRKSRYNWAQWKSGDVLLLRKGVDFDVDLPSLRAQLSTHASRETKKAEKVYGPGWRLECVTSRTDPATGQRLSDDELLIQFVEVWGDGSRHRPTNWAGIRFHPHGEYDLEAKEAKMQAAVEWQRTNREQWQERADEAVAQQPVEQPQPRKKVVAPNSEQPDWDAIRASLPGITRSDEQPTSAPPMAPAPIPPTAPASAPTLSELAAMAAPPRDPELSVESAAETVVDVDAADWAGAVAPGATVPPAPPWQFSKNDDDAADFG